MVWFSLPHLHMVLQSQALDQGGKRGEPEGSRVQMSLFFAAWTKVRRDSLLKEGGPLVGAERRDCPPPAGEGLACTDTLRESY